VRPSHVAFVVSNGREGEKARWREIGAVWPHKNGTGFDLVIADQLSVSGRIVCTPRRNRDSDGPEDER
jgi:hypothetical protein